MPIDRLILPGRGSFWKSSLRLRIGSPPNGSTCANIVMATAGRRAAARPAAPPRGAANGESVGASLLQRRLDVALHRFGRVVRSEALDHLAILADQELGEVPLDRLRAE